MVKHSQKCLFVLLTTVSITTIVNLLIMYWIPISIPISSFSAVRMMFIAYVEKQYYLILFSLLICGLEVLSIFSIRKKKIIFPVLLIMYLIFDFCFVMSLLVGGIDDGYWNTYIVQILVLIALIVLLCIYCWSCLRNNLH